MLNPAQKDLVSEVRKHDDRFFSDRSVVRSSEPIANFGYLSVRPFRLHRLPRHRRTWVTRESGKRGSQSRKRLRISSSAIRPSSRASAAPRQKWVPTPKGHPSVHVSSEYIGGVRPGSTGPRNTPGERGV